MDVKSSLEKAFQFLLVGLSAYVVVVLLGMGRYYQIATPIGVLILYLLLISIIMAARIFRFRLFNSTSNAVGKYLSVHKVNAGDPVKAAIFDIKYSPFKNQYRIVGKTIQMGNPTRQIGGWESIYLDIEPGNLPEVKYLYSGEENGKKGGVGYAIIFLMTANLAAGEAIS
jgi:hypothetical protein